MSVKNIPAKSNIQKNTQDNIFSWYNGNKNYVVVCCVSYDDEYADDNGESILESKCYRYEYYDVPAKSVEDAVRLVKKIFPKYLKNNLPYTFYRDKKMLIFIALMKFSFRLFMIENIWMKIDCCPQNILKHLYLCV